MPNRDVTITLKVKDGEVKTATASVERLKKAASDVGPISASKGPDGAAAAAAKRLGISYDDYIKKTKLASAGSREVTRAITDTANAVETATPSVGKLGSGLAMLGPVAGAVTAILGGLVLTVAAVAAGVLWLTAKIIEVTKEFAAYGKEIGNAQERTGLAARTISALSSEVTRLGGNFSTVQDSLTGFAKKLGDAANGSKKAVADITRLGLDPKKAFNDLDGSLRTVLATINRLPPGVQQITAATDAFGEQGQQLLPFLKQFDGDLDKIIANAERFGVVLSEDDVRASKEFEEALSSVQTRVRGIGYTFGREFLPEVKRVLDAIDQGLENNRGSIEKFASNSGDLLTGLISRFRQLVGWVQDLDVGLKVISGNAAGLKTVADILVYGPMYPLVKSLESVGGAALKDTIKHGRAIQAQEQANAILKGSVGGFTGNYLGAAPDKPKAPKLSRDDRTYRDLQEFARIMDFTVTRTTKGRSISGMHPAGLAADFRTRDKTEQEIGEFIVAALQKGIRIVDERTKIAGSPFWSGPHLHGEINERRASNFNEKLSYGNIPIEMLRQLDAQRLKKTTGFDPQDITAFLGKESDQMTKAAQDKITQGRIDFLLAMGLVPDSKLINRIQAMLVEEAKKTGTVQPTDEQILQAFQYHATALRDERPLSPDVPAALVATFTPQKTFDQQWVEDLREGLGLSDRYTNLILRQRNLQAEISVELESQSLARDEATLEAEKEYQVLLKRNLIDEAALDRAFQRNALIREIGDLQKEISNAGANDALVIQAAYLRDILDLRNRELDAVIRINRAQLELSQSMKISGNQIRADVYDHLASQRTLNQSIADGITQTYDEIGGRMDEQIDKMFEWAGAFKSLFAEPLKGFSRNGLTKITKGLLDAIVPGLGGELTKTSNPIALPIVEEIEKSNQLLGGILKRLGGTPVGTGVGGLALGALTSGLGGGGIPGIGPGGTGVFNPFGGGFNLNGPTGSISTLPNGQQAVNVRPQQSIFSRLNTGLFGQQGFGNNVGTYGGIGALAGLAGGAIGGRAGGIILGIGSGLAIGAQIGSIIPGIGTAIGAAVGAVGGLLAGLFGGDPKRKADKKENIPALNRGFADALKQLNEILAGVRTLSIEPEEAVSRAEAVRAEIAGGFGIQFQSKKYRKQAQTMIAGKLGQADTIIKQIKDAAAIARGAADRSKRILPEFAGGGFIGSYFADFYRPNGLLPGMFDGRDDILAALSKGELVINPDQRGDIIRGAGYDVFAAHGQIPNYPKGSTSPKLAMGGIANAGLALSASPNITVQPNFTMYVTGVNFEKGSKAWVVSDDGKRTIVKMIKEEKKADPTL